MKIKAVFFDFGGTLMSTESDRVAHYHLMQAVKRKYQLKRSVEKLVQEYEKYTHSYPNPLEYKKSHGMNNIKNALFQILQAESKVPDYRWLWSQYLKAHLQWVRLNPNASSTCAKIKNLGLHLGLISDVDDSYLYKQLEALKILNLFDSITTSEEVGFRKPAKEIFRVALKKARCRAQSAIYVGDKVERDIAGAKALSLVSVLFSKNASLQGSKADFTISELAELLGIISELS